MVSEKGTKLFEEYRSIREEIFREHGQINSRMGWFLTYQSILVAGSVALFVEEEHELSAVLSFVGFILSVAVRSSINAAIDKIQKLRKREEIFVWEYEKINLTKPLWEAQSTDDIDKRGLRFTRVSTWTVIILWIVFVWLCVLKTVYRYV